MRKRTPKPIKRRLLNAYVVSTLSITLVLFLVGLLTLLLFNARYLNQYIRENIGFTLVLDENVREVDLLQLQKMLTAQPEVKSATYIDAERAGVLLQEELGEDFISFLGYNPLTASIDVKLYAEYTQNDSLQKLELKFLDFPNVEEVYYQRNLVNLINENSGKVSFIIGGLALIMLLIFIALINNTIRLSVYSKRFNINTMQLVGATRGFIRKPFISQGMLYGLIGGLLANLFLVIIIINYDRQFHEIINYRLPGLIAIVFAIVVFSGIILSSISTTFAVNKFLRLKYDELFY